jgi:flavin-dependent dehydrogenase
MMRMADETTVAIIGGGPAGATLGAYLSLAGVDNVIFEREQFPRHHIGESLVPITTGLFQEIGFLAKMDAASFVQKRGAVWVPKSGTNSHELRLAPDPRYGRDYTYHVDRPKFDQMLLDHASELGSRVYQETQVDNVVMEGDRIVGLEVRNNGRQRRIGASYVVDASGRGTFLGARFGLKRKDPLFNQFAIYAQFTGIDRGPDKTSDHIHIFFLPTQRGWVWQIPISETVTSIGVVTEREDFRLDSRDREQYFLRHVGSNPELARRMERAKRIGGFHAEGDYSYSMDSFIGPGYLLTGDAARFVDPIFSSGVSVAMHSAKFACEALTSVLSGARPEQQAFEDYQRRLKDGVDVWYEFIKIYYKLQNLFSLYIQRPEYAPELLRLLQGDVYDRKSITVLDRLKADIRAIEIAPHHLLKEALTEIQI